MPDGARLSGFASADHVHHHIERFFVVRHDERLTYDHAAGLAREEVVHGLLVHHDVPGTFLDENTRHRRLAPARAVIIVTDHRRFLLWVSDIERLRLLRRMRVRRAWIAFEL